jgi:hypothetical protein
LLVAIFSISGYYYKCFIFSALHWVLSPEPDAVTNFGVPLVEDLMSSQDYLNSSEPIAWLRQAMLVNSEQISRVASLTVGQRNNPLWSSIRKLRFTASNFGSIIGAAKRNK